MSEIKKRAEQVALKHLPVIMKKHPVIFLLIIGSLLMGVQKQYGTDMTPIIEAVQKSYIAIDIASYVVYWGPLLIPVFLILGFLDKAYKDSWIWESEHPVLEKILKMIDNVVGVITISTFQLYLFAGVCAFISYPFLVIAEMQGVFYEHAFGAGTLAIVRFYMLTVCVPAYLVQQKLDRLEAKEEHKVCEGLRKPVAVDFNNSKIGYKEDMQTRYNLSKIGKNGVATELHLEKR